MFSGLRQGAVIYVLDRSEKIKVNQGFVESVSAPHQMYKTFNPAVSFGTNMQTVVDISVKIGDEIVSQLMFVIGTDGGGLEHPNWQQNLKFAIKVQAKANELYPGLFRPILLRNSRYNQQLGRAACIIEVGATGNTLEQSMASMKYLSKVLDEVLK